MSNPVYNPVRLSNGRLLGHTSIGPSVVVPVPEDGYWLSDDEMDEYKRIMLNRKGSNLFQWKKKS